MVTVGYARVSTREQSADSQTDVLEAAGCARVFVDHASGTLARRPALTDALSYLREGDTLVVTKLDRLGRSVKNLKEVADELERRGVGLRALSQGIDTTTPGGRLFFHMRPRPAASKKAFASSARAAGSARWIATRGIPFSSITSLRIVPVWKITRPAPDPPGAPGPNPSAGLPRSRR